MSNKNELPTNKIETKKLKSYSPKVPKKKIYLNPGQVKYKAYFEKSGYEVVISNTLPSGIDIIYENLDDKE